MDLNPLVPKQPLRMDEVNDVDEQDDKAALDDEKDAEKDVEKGGFPSSTMVVVGS